jgi:hypothetical protein
LIYRLLLKKSINQDLTPWRNGDRDQKLHVHSEDMPLCIAGGEPGRST